jgi:O-antigen/teichoic acid export membrane protein
MIIGKILGAADTGMFSKAFGLVDTFNRLVLQSVSSFSTPHFSARIRAGLDVRGTYLYAVSLITGIGWPFFTLLAFCSEPIVYLLLGSQWDAAAPIARVLCLAAAVSTAFAASGGAKDYTKYMTVSSAARIAAVLGSAWFGLHAVAWSLAAASTFAALVAIWMLDSRAHITPRQLWSALRPSFGVAAAAVVGGALPAAIFGPQNSLLQLLAVSLSVGIGSLIAARWLRHPSWQELVRVVTAARALFRAG